MVSGSVKIPMFPLTLFPLPGELVPLHIFESRYRQLLEDAEKRDISFGIFFNHVSNLTKLGSLVKLESVIKRYPGGESDIIVKCIDLFRLVVMHRTFCDKLYPGGEVEMWNVAFATPADKKLVESFESYLKLLMISRHSGESSVFHIANELNLDLEDRLKFVMFDQEKKESFLLSRLRYQKHLLLEADRAKDVFHLN
jgi:Lon protease-like protein